jgi:hypothetical protein
MTAVVLLVFMAMPLGLHAADAEIATIVNSGSTNRPGFRIVVHESGSAEFTASARRARPVQQQRQPAEPVTHALPAELLRRLQSDLNAAKPLASLPAVHCAKSVSFGSVLKVAIGDDESPDLSCGDGGNAAMGNIARDVNDIVQLFRSS